MPPATPTHGAKLLSVSLDPCQCSLVATLQCQVSKITCLGQPQTALRCPIDTHSTPDRLPSHVAALCWLRSSSLSGPPGPRSGRKSPPSGPSHVAGAVLASFGPPPGGSPGVPRGPRGLLPPHRPPNPPRIGAPRDPRKRAFSGPPPGPQFLAGIPGPVSEGRPRFFRLLGLCLHYPKSAPARGVQGSNRLY